MRLLMTIVPLDEHRDSPRLPSRPGPGAVIALAEDYWRLASKIAGTEFVPTALRKRPEAVLAALLSGAERGLGPMESLRSVHVIEGRPSLSAEAMRALVYAAGHEIDIVESNAQRATVVGRRAGSDTTSPPFTWTMDRARRARLAGKDVWQRYPEAMLLARATAELARALFPDVIAGLAVTEEISDELEPEPVTTRRTPPRTRRLAAAPATDTGGLPATGAATQPTTPPAAPRERTADEVDLGGIPGADEPSWAPGTPADTAAESKKAATAFARRLNAELNKAFPDADRARRDRYRHALVACITRGRDEGPVTSSSELTEAEQMATSKAMLNIAAGTATITDGPDSTVELRGKDSYTVTFDPLTVTTMPPSDGLPANPEFHDASQEAP